MKKAHIGSSFDSFLEEEGLLEEVNAKALKEMIAEGLQKAMTAERVTITELGKRMGTSRTAVHRLIDPKQTGLTLESLGRAAGVLNRRLLIRLEPKRPNAVAAVKRSARSKPPVLSKQR